MPNEFDFIINNQPTKHGGFAQGSLQKKLIVFVGFAIVLIVGIVLFSSLINSGKPSASGYVPITVYQEELIRILDNRDQLEDTSLLAQYTTLYLAVSSDYQESTGYLTRNGIEITPEMRGPYYYFDLETDLETATSASRFDAEFVSYVDQAVADYSSALVALQPTTGQEPLIEQAKQNIIYYNGRPAETAE